VGIFWIGLRWWRGLESGPVVVVAMVGAINLALAIFAVRLVDQWSARYLVPFFVSLTVGFGWVFARTTRLTQICLSILLVGYLVANLRAPSIATVGAPALDEDRHLLDALTAKGISAGYADYWISYRLTALSREQLIVVPTSHDNRYPPYLDFVRAAHEPVLISRLTQAIPAPLELKGQRYSVVSEERIGLYTVYYLRKSV
jgi:hypothetical protein